MSLWNKFLFLFSLVKTTSSPINIVLKLINLKEIKMIKKLAKSIREYKTPSLLTSLFVFFEVILEVLIPYIIAYLINERVYASGMNMILKLGALLSFMALLSLLFGFLSGAFCAKASSGFAKNLRGDMFSKIQTYSFANIDKFSPAGLVTRLTTDVNFIQNAYQMIIRTAIRAPMMLILALSLTFTINLTMALILLIASPILVLGLYFILKKVHPVFRRVIKEYDDMNKIVQENVRAARVVKSYVREDYEIKKFENVSDLIYKDNTKARKMLALTSPLMQFVIYACMIFIAWFGAEIIVRSGGSELETGQLATLFSYTMQILMSLMMLSFILVSTTIARPSAERVIEVLEEKPSIVNPENPLTKVKNGDVDFDNVSFSYKGDISKLCLKDINLHIKSGQVIGILGGTGSSKTTLISLIPRLYDTTSGTVYVGGRDVREYDLETLRDSVSVVLQKNVLFSGTIIENLKWGNKNATMEEIKHACKVACADEFIEKMPDKYETYIEEGGTNVSGGQKQRLCIARALLKKPKILILDDSTSAVDTKTDTMIRKAFREELPKTTKIIISQRVSSIQDADLIIIMESGKILQTGTHSDLLKTSELYKDLYESQNNKRRKK